MSPKNGFWVIRFYWGGGVLGPTSPETLREL